MGDRTTATTGGSRELVFRDERSDLGKLGHLVPTWAVRLCGGPAVSRERGAAVFAGLGGDHDHEIDSFRRDQSAMGAPVAGLTSRSAARFLPLRVDTFAGGGPVRRRGLGGVGGVLLPPGQLMFEIRNLPVEIDDLLVAVDDLLVAVRQLLLEFGNLSLFATCFAPQIFNLFAEPLILTPEVLKKRCGNSSLPTTRNAGGSS